MKKIGITGQHGFIGTHLANNILLQKDEYELIPFKKESFEDQHQLKNWVSECDIIIHLAGINRHDDLKELYRLNVSFAEKLIAALEEANHKPFLLFSSSIQEENNNEYGNAKKKAREILHDWSIRNDSKFCGLLIPNVFGPLGKPFYNSGIATFCYQLTHELEPKVLKNNYLKLIYIDDLIKYIFEIIRKEQFSPQYYIPATYERKVSDILLILDSFKRIYFEKGEIPDLKDPFHLNLFNTFRAAIDHKTYFPRKFSIHSDERGVFVELIKLYDKGQISFSTTKPGIIRGNHFHTRKIERFAVIKGRAIIKLRCYRTDEVISFEIDGTTSPAYVDMPVWYSHNIANIGEDELITVFWINEIYDPNDADTYMENVN
ncbi:UDP-2-acetamido-2,6-beta-L-arabino-hexul-4-ose reductase [Hydrobacter penzbergensis]|uniref:UDP-2-acetamido-2,6-beta-L-arabino-hexul-4-ose reductase n=1 Tax=Hydrobacter penzbergensis TaxID=1235997 RepID=A0A8X8LBC0_9BACT|nr:NAD-dependent epimerase/dehydratase family protein [Hydrobacter penzbergensis]SDW85354.1 UDP-2-acetamido-2,6-beta-L-arabino-hexul-4-ose reductase [Hydrobacter penzbergensis]